jgi:quercetin dioxygenase-like cupin family protein
MKYLSISDLLKIKNPSPGKSPYMQEVISGKQLSAAGGMMEPHSQNKYHYHVFHESFFLALEGEATEIIEGKEYKLKPNDILYIAAGEKHQLINKSDREFRYFEMLVPARGDDPDSVEVQ